MVDDVLSTGTVATLRRACNDHLFRSDDCFQRICANKLPISLTDYLWTEVHVLVSSALN